MKKTFFWAHWQAVSLADARFIASHYILWKGMKNKEEVRSLAEAPERPTVLFMHHPPFRTAIEHMDVIGLNGAEALGALVERHPQIERILCGHLHRPIQVRWRGTLAATAPSTAHQVVLDLRPGADGAFALEPPGYQLHVWTPEAGIVSHTTYVGKFDGPHPFVEPG
jgi:3',5'-cyclic AMP phosphodiesterase CpdA